MIRLVPSFVALALALIAGWTDWRFRRIPNWLTVPSLVLGIAANTVVSGWSGAKDALLGAGLGLLLLLPLVLLRSLGAGDWKLVGAIGACVGLHHLLPVLILTVLINGVVAVGMMITSGRVAQTGRNMLRMLKAMLTLHAPEKDLTLDNPDALKVPFGVAAAVAVVAYTVLQVRGMR